MALKSIFVVLVLALLVAFGWRHRQSDVIRNLMPVATGKPKPIVFDNGSVRAPTALPSSAAGAAPTALHAMRKCQRGTEIVYTDNPCKEGFRERPITSGSVTVMESSSVPKMPLAPQQTMPRATLHDVLDESGNANLREKRIERAINR